MMKQFFLFVMSLMAFLLVCSAKVSSGAKTVYVPKEWRW